jgi:hypothetical protein
VRKVTAVPGPETFLLLSRRQPRGISMLWRRRVEREAGARREPAARAESQELRSLQNRALAGLAGGPFAVPPLDERGCQE